MIRQPPVQEGPVPQSLSRPRWIQSGSQRKGVTQVTRRGRFKFVIWQLRLLVPRSVNAEGTEVRLSRAGRRPELADGDASIDFGEARSPVPRCSVQEAANVVHNARVRDDDDVLADVPHCDAVQGDAYTMETSATRLAAPRDGKVRVGAPLSMRNAMFGFNLVPTQALPVSKVGFAKSSISTNAKPEPSCDGGCCIHRACEVARVHCRNAAMPKVTDEVVCCSLGLTVPPLVQDSVELPLEQPGDIPGSLTVTHDVETARVGGEAGSSSEQGHSEFVAKKVRMA